MDKTNKELANEIALKNEDFSIDKISAFHGAMQMAKHKDEQYNSTERDGFIDIIATKLLYFMDIKGYTPTNADLEKIRKEFLQYIKNQEETN